MSTYVSNWVNGFEVQMWHQIEKCAVWQPHAARMLSVTVAVATLAKELFIPIAECVEHWARSIANSSSSFTIRLEDNQIDEVALFDQPERHVLAMLERVLIDIPLSPFRASYRALQVFASMVCTPVKTAKVHAAKADLRDFSSKLQGPYTAMDHIYAKAAFAQFQALIASCRNDADAAQWHFIDTATSIRELQTNMAHNQARFTAEITAAFDRIRLEPDGIARINQWKNLGKKLDFLQRIGQWSVIKADGMAEIAAMRFQ